MLCIVGTVPLEDFPLVEGVVERRGESLHIGASSTAVHRGTPALLAAATRAAETLGQAPPFTCLVGDTGTGRGSRHLYAHLTDMLPRRPFETIAFHYLQPIVHWHGKIQEVLGKLAPRPRLIADAGFMYVAKMSGAAPLYDLFTPDAGELAFLADEQAPHPFYTRGFILHEDNHVRDLIRRAYAHRNAAKHMIVKGRTDYLADETGILASVESPVEEALEAIGGTGDTLTGIVSVLIDSGMSMTEAAVAAMRANRLAGLYARPSPATQIAEIIEHIPKALRDVFVEGLQERG